MHVIALCGLPGSGKSTLAAALAGHTGFDVLNRDALRRQVFADGSGYSEADKQRLNALLCERMASVLAAGRSVILDGMTFAREHERADFRRVAERQDASFLLAWLDCPVELARERVANDRTHAAADREPALVNAVFLRFEPPLDAVRIDARSTTDKAMEIVLRRLREVRHET